MEKEFKEGNTNQIGFNDIIKGGLALSDERCKKDKDRNACNPCNPLANKIGDFVSLSLSNGHTVRGTVVGVFGDVLVLNGATIIVGNRSVTVAFYWIDCNKKTWFN